MSAHVDFCGEIHPVPGDRALTVGREGDVAIDDNPYLHRRFLEVSLADGLLWLANVGSSTSATVADAAGLVQAWLAPGARMPLVFARTVVWFTAGPTTYDLDIVNPDPAFVPTGDAAPQVGGDTTLGRVSFTPDQKLLILALAEFVLRGQARGGGAIPPSRQAAERLGWPLTKFNRKLDNVCDKLTRMGVRGLHGSVDRAASNRRTRLVEYALAARLVIADDLALLDALDGRDPSKVPS